MCLPLKFHPTTTFFFPFLIFVSRKFVSPRSPSPVNNTRGRRHERARTHICFFISPLPRGKLAAIVYAARVWSAARFSRSRVLCSPNISTPCVLVSVPHAFLRMRTRPTARVFCRGHEKGVLFHRHNRATAFSVQARVSVDNGGAGV